MIKLPCSLFLQTLTPVTLSLHCPISSSNAAAAAAFPGSDIRAFIGPFTIGYLYWLLKYCQRFELEVFTEDPRPEDPGPDPGPVRVRVYILNGQLGPGRVPIYYFGSRVCLTLCVIPESIGEHRTCQWSVSVGTLCVFCNLQLVKLGWEKYERE